MCYPQAVPKAGLIARPFCFFHGKWVKEAFIVEKLVITCALDGAEVTKELNPYLPVTPAEIAEDALRCLAHRRLQAESIRPGGHLSMDREAGIMGAFGGRPDVHDGQLPDRTPTQGPARYGDRLPGPGGLQQSLLQGGVRHQEADHAPLILQTVGRAPDKDLACHPDQLVRYRIRQHFVYLDLAGLSRSRSERRPAQDHHATGGLVQHLPEVRAVRRHLKPGALVPGEVQALAPYTSHHFDALACFHGGVGRREAGNGNTGGHEEENEHDGGDPGARGDGHGWVSPQTDE
ncbi:MAG TPA: 3-keto-5-aminohexanoate cleavage protein [Symbiobacteriaceae bacterium]|nr:3-keto-5-aminohexanoate cleavage protein [Symbiobacteriaceae bacterium]